MLAFINIDLSRLTNDAIYATFGNILNIVEKDPNLSNPPVTYADIRKQLADFYLFLVEKEKLSTNQRKDRKTLRTLLNENATLIGMYVIITYPRKESEQVATNFPASKTKEKMTGPPNVPGNLRVRNDKEQGVVIFNCDRTKGTVSINVKVYTKEPDNVPLLINSTGTRGVKINGLKPGVQYFIEVQAIGTKGISKFSSPVDIWVS